MSTDLQLRLDLPKIRVTIPTIKSFLNSNSEANDKNDAVNKEDMICTTPTSKENRIPAILSCPPAPRKRRRVVPSKRRLLEEFQFYEVVNREEVDGFFRSSSGSDRPVKRSCFRCL
ncbi:cyclin-dependent protein kinase inhibitor SMR1-like [Quillaja saponaria]|uniref:Cyclin-dependent protein kinase inhibitor SMR1-like n=1 Tax=Quillaja saponaria TaxID=32244 RepID=A0AAD7PWU4_QUISA|nr:cyclin-dependent protein kinase inhibitor SMR1-like [Quillaja saponaria]